MSSLENTTTPNTECKRFTRLKNNSILQNPLISSSSSSPPPPPSSSSSLQTNRYKSSISSLFLSTFTSNSTSSSSTKKKSFASATFRGLGCASPSPSEVSTPDAIQSSSDWQPKRVRKKKQRRQKHGTAPADVWCSADADSIDCVVSRPREDGERNQGQRSSIGRRINILEQMSGMDSSYALEAQRSEWDQLSARNHRNLRGLRGLRSSPAGFTEIMMLQSSVVLSGPDSFDRYRDWRLDVDNMSYEDLLELGDKIGYVSTGLREEEIVHCLRKMKHSILEALQPQLSAGMEWKCSICQEEYEAEDEVGKLECGHGYHLYCIKQWLLQKNACPVCKVAAAQLV